MTQISSIFIYTKHNIGSIISLQLGDISSSGHKANYSHYPLSTLQSLPIINNSASTTVGGANLIGYSVGPTMFVLGRRLSDRGAAVRHNIYIHSAANSGQPGGCSVLRSAGVYLDEDTGITIRLNRAEVMACHDV